jgi:hypothetical protein
MDVEITLLKDMAVVYVNDLDVRIFSVSMMIIIVIFRTAVVTNAPHVGMDCIAKVVYSFKKMVGMVVLIVKNVRQSASNVKKFLTTRNANITSALFVNIKCVKNAS